MSVDPAPGEARQTRRRQLRRRRIGALAVLGLLVAALVIGVVRALGGSSPQAQAGPPLAPRPAAGQIPTAHTTLRQRSERALDRFTEIGLPLSCGGHKGRYVALTFDDGPGPYTQRYAIPLFRKTKTRVTWFLVGRRLQWWSKAPRRELAVGAIGDHTWNHAYLPGLDANAVKSELASTQTQLEQETGVPVELFRPPYGGHNAAIDRQVQQLGMLEVLWSIDSRDSEGASWKQIARGVLRKLRPGSIVLFHENRGQTIRALEARILPALRRRHLRPVSVPELLALDPPTMKQLRAGGRAC